MNDEKSWIPNREKISIILSAGGVCLLKALNPAHLHSGGGGGGGGSLSQLSNNNSQTHD